MSLVNTIVEVKAQQHHSVAAIEGELQKAASSFQADITYEPVPMQGNNQEVASYIIRGGVDDAQVNQLKNSDAVVGVYQDTPIAPFRP